jgi:hypothetical protein
MQPTRLEHQVRFLVPSQYYLLEAEMIDRLDLLL